MAKKRKVNNFKKKSLKKSIKSYLSAQITKKGEFPNEKEFNSLVDRYIGVFLRL